MIYFTAHTLKCVCHCIRTTFRVLGVDNFVTTPKSEEWKSNNLLEQSAEKNWLSHSQVPSAVQVPWPLQFVAASHATIKDEKEYKLLRTYNRFKFWE